MTRIYTGSGVAHFYCDEHPIHAHAEPKRWLHLNAYEDPELDGGGHHLIVFVWAPGCVHLDDHVHAAGAAGGHPVLRGCDRGCGGYRLVAGDDPRAEGIHRPARADELRAILSTLLG